MRRAVVQCALLLMLLTACGQSRWATIAPCSLIRPDEVSRALGTTITTAHPQTDNSKYTICTYSNPRSGGTQNPLVILQINAQPITAAALKQSFAAAKVAIDPIAGIGDAAFYAQADKAADGTLFVIKSNQLFSVAITDSPHDQATTRHTLQLLAQTVLERLPN